MSARGGARGEACPGGHIGPPLRGYRKRSGTNGNWCRTGPCQRGGTGPAPLQGNQSRAVYGGVWSPRPTGASPVVPSSGPMWASAPTGRRGGCRDHLGQRRTAEHLRRDREERVGIGAEIIPKGAINAGQSLSHGCAVPAPFTQGSLALRGTGDADCRVGPAGLLAMTMVFCHSEERADVGIRPFYDGREFGPPRSSAPTENPINHPSQPARSEASAPAAARDGRESTQGPSQKGDRSRDCHGST